MATKSTQAAAVIVTALKTSNYQDAKKLRAALKKRNLPGYYLPRGVRLVRDAYGDDALVCIYDGTTPVYVFDPPIEEGLDWSYRTGKRALTESQHLLGVLDWIATNYGNAGPVRAARRYCKNLVAELDEIVEALTPNGQ